MRRTRNSLYYVAGYLYFGGAGFLLFPSAMLALLFAEGIYSSVTLRLLGGVMLALAIVVTGIIEREAVVLYRQTIVAKVPALLGLAYVAYDSLDRMWSIALVVVLVGWAYSVISYALDRRELRTSGSN